MGGGSLKGALILVGHHDSLKRLILLYSCIYLPVQSAFLSTSGGNICIGFRGLIFAHLGAVAKNPAGHAKGQGFDLLQGKSGTPSSMSANW